MPSETTIQIRIPVRVQQLHGLRSSTTAVRSTLLQHGQSKFRTTKRREFFFFFFSHFYFPGSRQAVVSGVVPSLPRFLPSIIIAHSVQQSHCSSIFHRVLLTHALALSASQFVHKKTLTNEFIRVFTRRGSNSRTDLYQARG